MANIDTEDDSILIVVIELLISTIVTCVVIAWFFVRLALNVAIVIFGIVAGLLMINGS